VISQAVILCGGLGTRLLPITKKIPKPMVKIDGKPFLEYLIMQCRSNGIKEVLLLCGYKYEVIKNYFKNGKKFGLKIKYHYNPPNVQTLKRIYDSRNSLKNSFLLLYSDNYSSLNIKLLESKLKKNNLVISLCKKKNGNILLNKKFSLILNYSKKREYNFVEIGYMILKKKFLINKKFNTNKELNFLIKDQINNRKIDFIINNQGYLSISDIKRLKKTKKYFCNNKIILLDRDGIINDKNKRHRYVRNLKELKLNKIFFKKYKKILRKKKVICITNQAGVFSGDVKQQDLTEINKKIINYFQKNNIKFLNFFISKHNFNSNHFDRKPNPGLFIKALKKYKFILDRTVYIGDDIRDIEASFRACCKCIYLGKKKLSKTQKERFKYTLVNLCTMRKL
jgi:histidinol-phosphate phosphatase family protein